MDISSLLSLAGGGNPIGAAMGATTAGMKSAYGLYQNILANRIKPQRTDYTGSQSVKDQLATVKQLYGSRGAGFAAAQDKIAQAQANTLASGSRNATDSASLLALAQGSQNQSNDALVDLYTKESQQKIGLLDNLQAAYDKMTQDDRLIWSDKMTKYNDEVQAKAALRNAGMQNVFGGMNDAASLFSQMGSKKKTGALSSIGKFTGGEFSDID